MYNFKNENNFYAVEIFGNRYEIGKMENGVFALLTDPYWQTRNTSNTVPRYLNNMRSLLYIGFEDVSKLWRIPDSRLMEVPGLISVYNKSYGNRDLKPEAQ